VEDGGVKGPVDVDPLDSPVSPDVEPVLDPELELASVVAGGSAVELEPGSELALEAGLDADELVEVPSTPVEPPLPSPPHPASRRRQTARRICEA
jgi:hypothetical protein